MHCFTKFHQSPNLYWCLLFHKLVQERVLCTFPKLYKKVAYTRNVTEHLILSCFTYPCYVYTRLLISVVAERATTTIVPLPFYLFVSLFWINFILAHYSHSFLIKTAQSEIDFVSFGHNLHPKVSRRGLFYTKRHIHAHGHSCTECPIHPTFESHVHCSLINTQFNFHP